MFYTLIDKIVVPCTIQQRTEDAWKPDYYRIAADTIEDYYISTVFMGLEGCLFETMIFGGELDQYQERYSTWGEAEEGHKRAVDRVKGILEANRILKTITDEHME